MNQQRSRRFRASKEGAELVEEKKRIREEVIQRGGWSVLRCAPLSTCTQDITLYHFGIISHIVECMSKIFS